MEMKSPVTAPSLSSRAREGPPVTPPPEGPSGVTQAPRTGPDPSAKVPARG